MRASYDENGHHLELTDGGHLENFRIVRACQKTGCAQVDVPLRQTIIRRNRVELFLAVTLIWLSLLILIKYQVIRKSARRQASNYPPRTREYALPEFGMSRLVLLCNCLNLPYL